MDESTWRRPVRRRARRRGTRASDARLRAIAARGGCRAAAAQIRFPSPARRSSRGAPNWHHGAREAIDDSRSRSELTHERSSQLRPRRALSPRRRRHGRLAAWRRRRAPPRPAWRGARKAVTPVVELYTSEGCNSCPPADRWISTLKADPAVVALAFHVDYWDRLGWKDRFSSAAFTERQAAQQAVNGARFSYTPQVVVDGRDRKEWPSLAAPIAEHAAAPVELTLAREGEHVTATVVARARAPKRLAAYWAVTEQNHVSSVKAGENQGVTLHHDFVVRDYRPVAAWASSPDAPRSIAFDLPTAGDAAHPRRSISSSSTPKRAGRCRR